MKIYEYRLETSHSEILWMPTRRKKQGKCYQSQTCMFYRSSDSSWQIFIEVDFISEKPSKNQFLRQSFLLIVT